ncbi:calponin homolog OV9M-like [Mya arenaria]|nr:calponin homolog OV9M-like [Mya arenaria]
MSESAVETKKPRKKFSRKQLRASQGMLTMQAQTNIYASQKGMTGFGAVRHGRDIRADNVCQAGNGELTMVAKTNIYASQKGMTSFGAVRHGSDIRADDASLEGLSTLSLQTGTNQFASQKGMTGFGSVRHGPDIRVKELYEEGADDEYPTDEDEPSPMKPAWKVRDEARDHGLADTPVHSQPEPVEERKRTPEPEPEPEPEQELEPVHEADELETEVPDELEEPVVDESEGHEKEASPLPGSDDIFPEEE